MNNKALINRLRMTYLEFAASDDADTRSDALAALQCLENVIAYDERIRRRLEGERPPPEDAA